MRWYSIDAVCSREISHSSHLVSEVSATDEHPIQQDYVCRSTTILLESGRHLGFAVVVPSAKFVPAATRDTHFNQLDGMAGYDRADTSGFKKPALLLDGVPGNRLLGRSAMLGPLLFGSGLFDCSVCVDRPGNGLSDPDPSGTPASFADDVASLIESLFPTDAFQPDVRIGLLGASGGAPFVAGIAANSLLQPRLRGVILISGVAMMRDETGSENANMATFRASANPLAPFIKLKPLHGMLTWLASKVSPWSHRQGLAKLDQIIATHSSSGRAEIEALCAAELRKAVPFDDVDLAWLVANNAANFRDQVYKQSALFELHGGRGVKGDLRVLSSHWDVDWPTARKLPWGLVHGMRDKNVPPAHAEWWKQQVGGELLFLEAHGHISSIDAVETLELMRRVLR